MLLARLAVLDVRARANSQTVEASRLTISQVQRGHFEDFLPLRARVAPLVTVYLDAVEGGRVEQLTVEDGAMVPRASCSPCCPTPTCNCDVLARQTEVEQQLNYMRSQELALSQTRSPTSARTDPGRPRPSKAQRHYDLQRPLAERGFVSRKVFSDSRDDL